MEPWELFDPHNLNECDNCDCKYCRYQQSIRYNDGKYQDGMPHLKDDCAIRQWYKQKL